MFSKSAAAAPAAEGAEQAVELAEGGEVFDRICEGPYSEADAATVVRQVATALVHMHSKGICHRDIKCSNVLLDATRTVAKVSDFGLAHVISLRESNATATPTELHAGAQICGAARFLCGGAASRGDAQQRVSRPDFLRFPALRSSTSPPPRSSWR